MKNWKKLASLLLAATLALTACGGGSKETSEPKESASQATSEEASKPAEEGSKEDAAQGEAPIDPSVATKDFTDSSLYLITDLGTIDDRSFNQGSFEGMEKFAKEIGVKANYLRPAGEGDQLYKQAIDQAIQAGAKIVVTPGFLFESAVGQAQAEYPNVRFVFVDAEPKVGEGEYKVAKNTVSILYREEQAGFLAGYAAVKDGYTKLGFMGGVAVPAVIHYGFGFAAGANYAAKELNTNVELQYNYTGSFEAKPEINTMAASWYKQGTEVIFACGGGIATSILKAAQENNGKMIGVDVDQKDLGEEVITSAMKNLSGSVYDAIKAAQDGKFPGGETLHLSVNENGVQLPDDFSRFKKFTKDEYEALYKDIVANKDGLADSIPRMDLSLKPEEQSDPTLLQGLDKVTLNYIK